MVLSIYSSITDRHQGREDVVGNYQNELEQFIYEVCYQSMWKEAGRYIFEHPYALDLTKTRIKYPTAAYLENLEIEFTCNIRIAGDVLSFDAVANCDITLIEESECSYGNNDTSQWLTISCESQITDHLESLRITAVSPYERGHRRKAKGDFSPNIVPYIRACSR